MEFMTEKQTPASTAKQLQRTVLIELDFAVAHALKPQAAACRDVLAKSGIELDESLFLRHFVGKTMTQGVSAMAQRSGKTVDVAAVVAELTEACRGATVRCLTGVKEVCGAFIKELAAKGLHVAIVTGVPESDAQQALGDLCSDGVVLLSEPQVLCGCYGWESWRRAVRKLQIRERLTVALVGGGLSSKGALSSGMHVIVRADPLAEFQDYSGVDLMVQKLDSSVRAEVLRLLRI
jgi:hypothetical protein